MPEATVKVRLQTKDAEKSLKRLNQIAKGSVGNIGGGAGGALLGGAVGGVIGGARRGLSAATGAGISDVAGGILGPILSRIQDMLFRGADIESSASKQAFEGLPFELMGKFESGSPEQKEFGERVLGGFKTRQRFAEQRLRGRRDAEQMRIFMSGDGRAVDFMTTQPGDAAKVGFAWAQQVGEEIARGFKRLIGGK